MHLQFLCAEVRLQEEQQREREREREKKARTRAAHQSDQKEEIRCRSCCLHSFQTSTKKTDLLFEKRMCIARTYLGPEQDYISLYVCFSLRT